LFPTTAGKETQGIDNKSNSGLLCSAESRCDLTLQFLQANIHGAARREYLALLSVSLANCYSAMIP
jgi:hypothetical protein